MISSPQRAQASRRKRVLVAYTASGTYVATTHDYLTSLARYMDADVRFVHATHDAILDFDLSGFDAVFHSYCARLCIPGYISPSYARQLQAFGGLKIAAVQDEYEQTHHLKQAIRDLGFDIVLTCAPPATAAKVYPKAEFPNVEFVQVLTGYVPDDLIDSPYALPLRERPIVLGYRGRNLDARYGSLGFDKGEIGRRMKAACLARGVPCDIEWTEEGRLYGEAWPVFLGSCRATLGTESGSNLFDLDGGVERRFREMSARLGRPPTHGEFFPSVRHLEDGVDMGQVSPRIFEAAALRTPMVLLRGRYSGVVRPDEHYIPLDKDYSNVDEVMEKLQDFALLETMAARAHRDLIASGAYSYRVFGRTIEELIETRRPSRGAPAPASGTNENAPRPTPEDREILLEKATAEPHHFDTFRYKQVRREANYYLSELTHHRRALADTARDLTLLQWIARAPGLRRVLRFLRTTRVPAQLKWIARAPIIGAIARRVRGV